MQFYMWDTGVVVGYCFWPGAAQKAVGDSVDPHAEKCDKFVTQKAILCQNRIPMSCESEARHRIRKNCESLNLLIDMINKRPYSSTGMIDYSRVDQIHSRILEKNISVQDATKGLIKIIGMIQSRKAQLYKSCHLLSFSKPPLMPEEKLLATHLKKSGDISAFSTAIHFHKRQPCIFITTDYHDFGTLNCAALGITCPVPSIEFIKDI